MKRHDKLPLKKAYYRIFTGMIVIPLVLVLVLSLVILGMQYREQAIENIRGVQKGVAAGAAVFTAGFLDTMYLSLT